MSYANKKDANAAVKRWRKENKEHYRAYQKTRYEYIAEWKRKDRKNHPEKYSVDDNKRSKKNANARKNYDPVKSAKRYADRKLSNYPPLKKARDKWNNSDKGKVAKRKSNLNAIRNINDSYVRGLCIQGIKGLKKSQIPKDIVNLHKTLIQFHRIQKGIKNEKANR